MSERRKSEERDREKREKDELINFAKQNLYVYRMMQIARNRERERERERHGIDQ